MTDHTTTTAPVHATGASAALRQWHFGASHCGDVLITLLGRSDGANLALSVGVGITRDELRALIAGANDYLERTADHDDPATPEEIAAETSARRARLAAAGPPPVTYDTGKDGT